MTEASVNISKSFLRDGFSEYSNDILNTFSLSNYNVAHNPIFGLR